MTVPYPVTTTKPLQSRLYPLLVGNLAVLAAYVITGRLGLEFAMVHGSVTLVWPPSGIAVAALTLWGARLLPGVVLGALITNLSTPGMLLFSLATTAGNPAGAWIAALLLRRVLRFRPAMDRVRDVFALSLAAAPAGGALAATAGVAALWALGNVTGGAIARTWLHWLLGDAMGIIVVAPIIFTLAAVPARPPLDWRGRLTLGWLLIMIALASLEFFGKPALAGVERSILIVPLLVVVALWFSPREVALANLLVGISAVAGSRYLQGIGHADMMLRSLLTLAMLLVTINLTVQALAAAHAERKAHEQSLRKVNRALRILSQCGSAMVQAADEKALLEEVCRICVGPAGYRMAWVGYAEYDPERTVRVAAFAGPGQGFLDRIHVSWADNEYGRGAVGPAIRTGQPVQERDMMTNPRFAPWREAFEARDFTAVIAVPLKTHDTTYGALAIYAAERDAFDDAEVELIAELGCNLAHGIMALRARAELTAALAALECAHTELEDRVVERTAQLRQQMQERIQTEEALRRNERKYRELVENANSIILRMDTQGRVTFFNEFAQQFFGFSEQEILGRSVVGTIVPDTESDGLNLVELMDQIARHPDQHTAGENENICKDGRRVWIAWTNRPVLDADGQVVETLCIGVDITELRRAKEAAEAADRIKSAFLATMSHELRTPLNSIIGFTGILLQGLAGPLNPEQTTQLGMVQTSARHLLALINDVLDISKIEAGQMEVSHEPFDPARAIEKVVQTVTPLARRKGLELRLELPPALPAIVGDQRRFEQVLMNLLGNAIKFTEQGRIRLECKLDGGKLDLCVCDTGMGIPDDQLAIIFLPFHQIDAGITRLHEGTGLGLSICKRLVELMGGSIGVTSEVGVGSSFHFTLPLEVGGNA